MAVNDQPSILTVCVPGVAMDHGALDLNELLAAREKAVASPRTGMTASDSSTAGATFDACDDSACGIDALGGSSGSLSERSCDRCGSELCETDLSENGVGQPDRLRELASGVNGEGVCRPSFFHADSGKKALELLRMLRFDLLVTGDQLPDMPVGHLIRRVRAAWPWQKWAMVGSVISVQDEIAARTLGALAVFDAPPDWEVLGSMAAVAAGKMKAIASVTVADEQNMSLESTRSLHVIDAVDSRESTLSRRGARTSDRSGSGAGSSRTGGSRSTSKAGGTRRAAVLPRRISDRSAG